MARVGLLAGLAGLPALGGFLVLAAVGFGDAGRAALGDAGRAALGDAGRAALGDAGRAAFGESNCVLPPAGGFGDSGLPTLAAGATGGVDGKVRLRGAGFDVSLASSAALAAAAAAFFAAISAAGPGFDAASLARSFAFSAAAANFSSSAALNLKHICVIQSSSGCHISSSAGHG